MACVGTLEAAIATGALNLSPAFLNFQANTIRGIPRYEARSSDLGGEHG